jgi:hypothetical protein
MALHIFILNKRIVIDELIWIQIARIVPLNHTYSSTPRACSYLLILYGPNLQVIKAYVALRNVFEVVTAMMFLYSIESLSLEDLRLIDVIRLVHSHACNILLEILLLSQHFSVVTVLLDSL